MILGWPKLAVCLIDPDRHLLEASGFIGGDNELDVKEPIGKDAQGMVANLFARAGQQTVVDVDRPAFEIALGV
jgi:hypothetical protein